MHWIGVSTIFLGSLFISDLSLCSAFQQNRFATIAGRIKDAETGNDLENVVVYIAYSSIGTSSTTDGSFRFSRVLPGEHTMVFQRLGYEQWSVHLNATAGDSLYYDIRLRVKPIEAKEVEILGQRAAAEEHQLFFFPHDTTDILCVYGAASSTPIGVLFADSAVYFYALEPAVIDSEKYLRFWLLYKNLSNAEHEIDPVRDLKLRMTSNRGSTRVTSPASPSRMLGKLQTSDETEMIASKYRKTLETLATHQTMYTAEQSHFELLLILDALLHQNITRGSLRPKSYSPALEGSLSASMLNTYMGSVNAGILQRVVVFPGNSVNGYVYFPFPGLDWKTGSASFSGALQYRYTLEITTLSGVRAIAFTPR